MVDCIENQAIPTAGNNGSHETQFDGFQKRSCGDPSFPTVFSGYSKLLHDTASGSNCPCLSMLNLVSGLNLVPCHSFRLQVLLAWLRFFYGFFGLHTDLS